MKYCRIIFLQGDEANEALEILGRDGTEATIEYLSQWDYGKENEHTLFEETGAGTSDTEEQNGGYVLNYNTGLSYVGLARVVSVDCSFKHTIFEVPLECAQDCSAQGSVDEAVRYWSSRVTLPEMSREEKIDGLLECGAWDREELEQLEDLELDEKILFTSIPDGYRRK